MTAAIIVVVGRMDAEAQAHRAELALLAAAREHAQSHTWKSLDDLEKAARVYDAAASVLCPGDQKRVGLRTINAR